MVGLPRRHLGSQRDHATADVEAHRTERDRALVGVGQDGAADRHPVAVVHVGGDHHQLDAQEPGGVDDLLVDAILDRIEKCQGQEESHRNLAGVGGGQGVEALTAVDGEGLPVPLGDQLALSHGRSRPWPSIRG